MAIKENENLFSTRDLYLAATLVTLKFYMNGVDFQIEGERSMPVGYFKFEESPELREAEKKFWQGLLAVEPRAFITNMRGLKAQVSNVYKGPHQNHSKFKKVVEKPKKSEE